MKLHLPRNERRCDDSLSHFSVVNVAVSTDVGLLKLPYGLAVTLADAIAPFMARWASEQERRILRDGMPLAAEQMMFTRALGITEPEEVRVLMIEPIPLPAPPWCVHIARRFGLPVFSPGGMALGRGVFLANGQWGSLHHELVHVWQYQRCGGMLPFFRLYLRECLMDGYLEAPLEMEARSLSFSSGIQRPEIHPRGAP
jgi:hypothetical protein